MYWSNRELCRLLDMADGNPTRDEIERIAARLDETVNDWCRIGREAGYDDDNLPGTVTGQLQRARRTVADCHRRVAVGAEGWQYAAFDAAVVMDETDGALASICFNDGGYDGWYETIVHLIPEHLR